MHRLKINENNVRQILMCLNIQADRASKLVIASYNLVAALAHKQNGGLP